MLANPPFADWVIRGDPNTNHGAAAPPYFADERFAAYEQVVARRTNGLVGPNGRLQPPWPRALGTPPWGARHEIEYGASPPGTRYALVWTRLSGIRRLGRLYDHIWGEVRAGRPVLLYVGNGWLPRHVVLALPGTADGRDDLDVYEPSIGRVVPLSRDAFVTRRLELAGWDVPWCLVSPR